MYDSVALFSACYGVVDEVYSAAWKCHRCSSAANTADCCFCLLRGGALKPTDGGRWAHLTCAMAIPELTLGDSNKRQPIMTEGLTRASRKLVKMSLINARSEQLLRVLLFFFCSAVCCAVVYHHQWQLVDMASV